jgi:hypothetical protein
MSAGSATTSDVEPTPTLSVGWHQGGPEAGAWNESLSELSQRVRALREGVDSQLKVNVVFWVPGSVVSPDFDGIRTGSFRRRDSLLMVQVALPTEPPDDAALYLRTTMAAAVDAADAWNVRRRKGFDTLVLHDLVRQL